MPDDDPPPPPDLPLNALRAFEAAARLGGFKAAARELGVSPGAITAHVKGLEARLGAALFRRHARGVTLTPLGASVLPGLSGAFDTLATAVHLLRAGAAPLRLSVATEPAVAALWLRPRLGAMQAAMPGLAVAICEMEAPPSSRRAPYDLWVFHHPEGAADWLVPVRAPGRPDGPRLDWPQGGADWAAWDRATGTPPRPATMVSDYAEALGRSRRGEGVAMGRGALVARDIGAGTLEEAGPRVPAPGGLRVTVPHPGRIARAAAAWIASEIDAAVAGAPAQDAP